MEILPVSVTILFTVIMLLSFLAGGILISKESK